MNVLMLDEPSKCFFRQHSQRKLVELTEPAGQADTKTSTSVSLDVVASANQISLTKKN